MPWAANARRFSVAILGLAAFGQARAAWSADGDTTGNFETVGAWTATINRFNRDIAGKINEITSLGSDYYNIGLVFMTALAAIYLVIAVTRYVFQDKNWPQLLGSIVYTAIVMAIFVTYGEVVRAFSAAPYAIATTLQTAALGTDDAFAPMVYLYKVVTNVTFKTDTAWYDIVGQIDSALSSGLFAVAFLFVQAVYLLAIAWATLWPIIYLFALKIIGFITIPFLFAGQLEFVFYGWLRQFFMLLLFILLVNGVLIANVLLVAFAFNLPFSAADTIGQTIVSGLLARALVIAIIVFGTVALFQAQRIAAAWTGSDALSSGLARTAAMAFTKGLVK
ncbi:hypothetical protein FFK22_019220 [Mycobacterium sp. KBS0706]|uniref:hypothetical protein n=1 Tax=Mycobacterium sp. KBS0706 TaxID=2578109 RepID=UPI00110FDD10|nr:hypothetical protein [Mycobacterium sp. KBS0706]TSD87023.1 hypothetical protein FFK22_019220 [Mycobacterium sp. KBS0706]